MKVIKKHNIMRTSFSYAHVLEYLPVRYSATYSQKEDRSAVYRFKDGSCEDRIFDRFVNIIKQIVGYNKSEYVICFIPASSQARTSARYSSLAGRLENVTGVKASLNAIKRTVDTVPGYKNGKTMDTVSGLSFDPYCFRGKRVILIDDVITRGRTFCQTANELLDNGASDVIGLFVAKTINPDWNKACA